MVDDRLHRDGRRPESDVVSFGARSACIKLYAHMFVPYSDPLPRCCLLAILLLTCQASPPNLSTSEVKSKCDSYYKSQRFSSIPSLYPAPSSLSCLGACSDSDHQHHVSSRRRPPAQRPPCVDRGGGRQTADRLRTGGRKMGSGRARTRAERAWLSQQVSHLLRIENYA